MVVKNTSVSGIRQKLKDILAVLDETGKPYFITQRNRPKAVVIRYEDYNGLVEQARERGPRIIRRPEISGGEPIIQGTRISVRRIVECVRAGQSVEDILAALPHLTAAQVHAALSYYYEYRGEIDELIEESRPERIIATQGLKVEKVADGVAIAHGSPGQ
jgi:prevent-host-death family protein